MKKRLLVVLTIIFSLFLLVGCSGQNQAPAGEGGADSSSILLPDSARKIIYTVDARINSDDFIKISDEIKSKMNSAEDWVEAEHRTNDSVQITLRIRTIRLNDFLEDIKSNYSPKTLNITSKDVSLEYSDTEAIKASIQKSIETLEALKESAQSVSEMLEIEKQLTNYREQYNKLSRDLIVYDSLIEYSTVRIYIYGRKADPQPPYGQTLSGSFRRGWIATLATMKFFLQAVVTLIPFLLIIVPVALIVLAIVFNKKIKEFFKKKKQSKEEPENKEVIDDNEELDKDIDTKEEK
jgi:hypothetical protein